MAHFAKLDKSNIVLDVITVNNNVINNISFPESEPLGVAFLQSVFGADTKWAQTSYNASFRYNYAGIGYTFDDVAQAFIPIQPFPSWLLNTETYSWDPPVPYPDDGKSYYWDEDTLSWVEN